MCECPVKNHIHSDEILYTVDPRYLEVQETIWNTSRYPYLDWSDLQNWGKNKSNNHISQFKYVIWLLKFKIYWKYCGKEEKLLLWSTFSSFPQYSVTCYKIVFYVKTGTRFSLRDKRLFEKREVEITRVDCTCYHKKVSPSIYWQWGKFKQSDEYICCSLTRFLDTVKSKCPVRLCVRKGPNVHKTFRQCRVNVDTTLHRR